LVQQPLRRVLGAQAGGAAPVAAPVLVPRVRPPVGVQGGGALAGTLADVLPPLLALFRGELHGAQPGFDPAADRAAQGDQAGGERVAEQPFLDRLGQALTERGRLAAVAEPQPALVNAERLEGRLADGAIPDNTDAHLPSA